MGNPKQKWTPEEEEALRAGVAKHGAGKWKYIQKDPEFNNLLFNRSNIDLKDKWRNLSAASGQLPRDKSKAPKVKGSQSDVPITPVPTAQTSASITPSSQDAPAEVVRGDSSRPVHEGSNIFKYTDLVFEAISTIKEANGSDCSSIAAFIEQRHQVPQNFRRLLSSSLGRLVQQDKLEKVLNYYRIKADAPPVNIKSAPIDTTGPSVKPKDPQPKPVESIGYRGDTIAEAAAAAAYKVAEAENKAFVAADAVKEAERVAGMAEEMEAILQFAMECVEKTELGELR